MITIVLTAENYAFGPSGKLLTIASLLRKKGYKLIFIGEGTAYQLCNKFPFHKKYKCDTSSSAFVDLAKKVFLQSDMLISAMDKPSVSIAQTLNLPVAFIDSLFWYWYEIPDYLWSVEFYFSQRSLQDTRNMQKYAQKIRNFINVGPIIDEKGLGKSNKNNQLLITFGGMEAEGWYKVGVDTHYPFVLTDLIFHYVNLKGFKRVVITGNEQIIHKLTQKYNNIAPHVLFIPMSHERFLFELGRSSCLLCTPGLETTLEGFFYQIPVVFLPPSNSSQYMQLDEFRKSRIAPLSIHFSDFYEHLDLVDSNSHLRMSKFLEQLWRFEQDVKVQQSVASRLSAFLNDRRSWSKQIIIQKKFMDSLGGNGASIIVNYIHQYLSRDYLLKANSEKNFKI